MALKGAATILARLSRAILSHPYKQVIPVRVHEIPRHPPVPVTYPTRYYLFPSVYRSFFSCYGRPTGSYQQSLAYLTPLQAALHEIKRRLFFAGLCFNSLSFAYTLSSLFFSHTRISPRPILPSMRKVMSSRRRVPTAAVSSFAYIRQRAREREERQAGRKEHVPTKR